MICCDTFLKNINIPTVPWCGKSRTQFWIQNLSQWVQTSEAIGSEDTNWLAKPTWHVLFAADENHVSAPNQLTHEYLLIILLVPSTVLGAMAAVKKSKRHSLASSKGQGRGDYTLGQAGPVCRERHSQILKWHVKSYGKTSDRLKMFSY